MYFHLFIDFKVTILLSNNRKKILYDRVRIMVQTYSVTTQKDTSHIKVVEDYIHHPLMVFLKQCLHERR